MWPIPLPPIVSFLTFALVADFAVVAVLCSATIDADLFSSYFGGCAVVEIPGRSFPVTPYFLEDILETIRFRVEPNSPYARRGRGPSDALGVSPAELRELPDADLSAKMLSRRYPELSRPALEALSAMCARFPPPSDTCCC